MRHRDGKGEAPQVWRLDQPHPLYRLTVGLMPTGAQFDHTGVVVYAGRYSVISEVGSGQFASVFLVHDLYIAGRKRIIKMFQEPYHEMALSEARLLTRLNEVGRRLGALEFDGMFEVATTGSVGLVMESLDPLPLKLRSPSMVRRLILDVALILNVLHSPRFSTLHADIKLENILYASEAGRFRLIDFGNCIPIAQKDCYYGQFGAASLLYRAPEVLVGHSLDTSLDIWSLGVVVLEMLIGSPPFMGTTRKGMLLAISELLGPFPEPYRKGKFYDTDLPMTADFQTDKFDFWHRWRLSNLAKLLGLRATADREMLEIILGMLEYDPRSRLTATQVLQHPFLAPLVPIVPSDHDPDTQIRNLVNQFFDGK